MACPVSGDRRVGGRRPAGYFCCVGGGGCNSGDGAAEAEAVLVIDSVGVAEGVDVLRIQAHKHVRKCRLLPLQGVEFCVERYRLAAV